MVSTPSHPDCLISMRYSCGDLSVQKFLLPGLSIYKSTLVHSQEVLGSLPKIKSPPLRYFTMKVKIRQGKRYPYTQSNVVRMQANTITVATRFSHTGNYKTHRGRRGAGPLSHRACCTDFYLEASTRSGNKGIRLRTPLKLMVSSHLSQKSCLGFLPASESGDLHPHLTDQISINPECCASRLVVTINITWLELAQYLD